MYKIGIYGGSFNPLHLGHVDCIIQAANQCEKLYLVLSVGFKRNEIPARIRYRSLYNLVKHIGNVELLILEDACDSKDAYTTEQALKDAAFIKRSIGKPIDVVFYGDDYDERSFWHQCYPDSQFISFPRNEISSTKIRENPYAHWGWLPKEVRAYYVKKVLIIGGESTGKSTITINLAHRFNTNYLEEVGREISLRSGTDAMMLPEDYTEILLQHKLREMQAVQESNKVLFIDTDALITEFYLHFLDSSTAEANLQLAKAIDGLNEYDLILFFEPDVDFVQDGSRNEEIHNDREKYSEQIKNIFREHGKQFTCISGSYQERYMKAVQLVEKLLG